MEIKCCHGNQIKWSLVIKHINWVNNHLMFITANYRLHHFTGYGENAIKPFSHYKSMGAFCCHGNQTKRQSTTILAIFNCPYPSNICTNLKSYCFSSFKGFYHLKNSFFKTECYHGNAKIWFISLHWIWRKYNLTLFQL